MDIDATTAEESQRSILSPRSSQKTASRGGSQQDIGGLIIPQSASSFMGGSVGGLGGLSARGSVRPGMDEGGLLDDDLGLMVGDNGALFDDLPVRQSSALPSRGGRADMGAVSSKSWRERDPSQQAQEMVRLPTIRCHIASTLTARSSASRMTMASCLFKTTSRLDLMTNSLRARSMQTYNRNKRLSRGLRPHLSVVALVLLQRLSRSTSAWSWATVS